MDKILDKINAMKKFLLIVMLVVLAAGGCYGQKKGDKQVYSANKATISAKSDTSSFVLPFDSLGNLIVKRNHVKKQFGTRKPRSTYGPKPIYV